MTKLASLIAFAMATLLLPLHAMAIEIHWNYNKFYHNKILGYRVYMGSSADALTQKILDIKKTDLTVYSEQPFLLEEHFDQDPGTKYTPLKGNWTWTAETKNMHIEAGSEFMLVFEKPAGATSDMAFTFWPEKSSSDQPIVYSYIKDESIGAYYELRLAGSNGTRYSNWRKVYDQKFGGIDPNGAFPLPRYPQCVILENQHNYCPGFKVFMSWNPDTYVIELSPNGDLPVMTASVTGVDVDKKALDINKLEIIINNQGGWIDDIMIGGNMEIGTEINLTLPQTPVYFAASAYYQDPNDAAKILETAKSIPVEYTATPETKRKPLPIKNMRKTP